MNLGQKIDLALREIENKLSFLDKKILLGFSGGKDSLVCFDLCSKIIGKENIVPFFMEFIPNLRITKELLEEPIKRFDIKKIHFYPSEVFIKHYRYGYYGFENKRNDAMPIITRKDIVLAALYELKLNKVVMGIKKIDNLKIKWQVEKNQYFGGGIYPIYDWNLEDILTYLKINKIEIPKHFYQGFRGVGLDDYSILYLNDFYPDDLDKIEEYFPFIKAIVKKYEYYKLKRAIKRI